jgi:hypothetical protein
MMINLDKKQNYIRLFLSDHQLNRVFSLLAALFVARVSLGWFDVLFFPLLVVTSVIILLKVLFDFRDARFRLRGAIGAYPLFLLVLVFFVFALINSYYEIRSFRNEAINMGSIIVLILAQLLLLGSVEDFMVHRNRFFRALFYLITFTSATGVVKLWLYLRGIEVSLFAEEKHLALGTSLIDNPDQFITAIVAAMIGVILYKFRQKSPFLLALLYHSSFLLMFYTIIWSGSKKGFLLMLLLFVILILVRLFFIFHHSRGRNYNLIKNLNIVILTIGFSSLIGTWVINLVPGEKKEQWIGALGFDRYHFKSEVTMVTFSHLSTFNHEADLQRWYDRLWGYSNPAEEALHDKILFVLIEQENLSLAPEITPWAEKAFGHRRQRLEASIRLFSHYTDEQKLWGQGFHYLNHFSSTPIAGPTAEPVQYRNNYLVSALLYSGVLGLLALVGLLLQVFRTYWVNRKELLALAAIFMVNGILFLLSYNTLLSVPIMLLTTAMALRVQSFAGQQRYREK